MRPSAVLVRLLAPLLLALVLTTAAAAQSPSPLAAANTQIGRVESDLEAIGGVEADLKAIDRSLDTRVDIDQRRTLRADAVAAQQAARDSITRLQAQLALIKARVAEIGPIPAGPGADELRRQRAGLAAKHDAIDVAIRRGKLADVEAQQLVDEIDRSQAEQFGQTLTTRVDSPITPAFWRALFVALPRDARRVDLFLRQGGEQIGEQWRGGWPWQTGVGLALAFLLLFPARLLARRAGQLYLVEGAPGHRVRRSANALWRVTTGTLAPLLAAIAAVQGFRWAGLLPTRWSGMLDAVVVAVGFGGFTAAVTGAVLMRSQPSWRIAPIRDDVATRLRPLSWGLALLAALSILLTAFVTAIGASRAATVATDMVEALFHLLLAGALLVILGRLRARREDETKDGGDVASGTGLGAATLLLWLMVIAALVALLLGYAGFSLFIAQFIAWATVLGCAVYLLLVAVDDVATTVFTRNGPVGVTLSRALGVRGSMVEQFGLLLSGALRMLLVVVALGMLLSPFGSGNGVGGIFSKLGSFAGGVTIGGVAISPASILRGMVVLFVGLALVRWFMRWLEDRYLPATDLDGSGRNSVSLVVRYVGIGLAGLWALASLGIGVERIALLLSALSVGIGFGLQAITQNFVSGLILLAERPIKIGDLVRVGNDEGDVRRISVRSTEIELADHSMLIVPNSDLITKPVLNKTLSGLGRIQIQFSVPIETDIDQVRDTLAAAIHDEPQVLADPAPVIFVDSIAEGRILINSFAHVGSPRAAYPARSAILAALLRRFAAAGIAIGTVPQRLELIAPHDFSEKQ